MSGTCCNEYGCKRKQPIHLMRGPFTRRWYVVTKWKEGNAEGSFIADEKHELKQQYQQALDEAFPFQEEDLELPDES